MHVSALSHQFVKDPHQVVKAGDIVKVKVVEVDLPRKRIALTMKLGAAPQSRDAPGDNRFAPARSGGFGGGQGRGQGGAGAGGGYRSPAPVQQGTAMGDAFSKLQGLRK